MSILGESAVYCEELSVVYVVVAFGVIERLRVKSYCSVFTSAVLLGEYGACGKSGRIDLQEEWFNEVWLLE